jgi:hypothetical protein
VSSTHSLDDVGNMETRSWQDAGGTWTREGDKISQTTLETLSRTYVNIGMTDFILETTFRMVEGKGGLGEAKVIFSNADKGEDYRIDFMSGTNLCRITAGGIPIAALLFIAKQTDYKVKLIVKKNFVSVKVNDISVFSNFQFGKMSDGKIGLGTFDAQVSFTQPTITPFVLKRCFVIMPFDEQRNFLYENVIVPTLDNHPVFGFEYSRADKLLTTGKITEEIDERISKSDLIIADITEDNRNVYYELGLAHAKGRKAVLLKQRTEGKPLDLPFDIKDFRIHGYEFSTVGFGDLRTRLTEIVTNAIDEDDSSSQ